METVLTALRPVLFDWTVHVDQVWADSASDIPELHSDARKRLDEHLEDLVGRRTPESPLGVVLRGAAGSGKTHLLSYLRRAAHRDGAFFVLVDMTDVRDFWETVLLGYLRSLQQPTATGERQLDAWLHGVVGRFGQGTHKVADIPSQRPPGLILRCDALARALSRREGPDAREHADVLRALLLFACNDDDINDMGYKWLQGIGIDAEEQALFGFRRAQQHPGEIVKGLSWLLSLVRPAVLAFDQLDAIVSEHNSARGTDPDEMSPRQAASLSIIRGIAGGLMSLLDRTRRTLTVVSVLEATWSVLLDESPAAVAGRFDEPIALSASDHSVGLRDLIAARLAPSYRRAGVRSVYPTYPFSDAFFTYWKAATPREVLRACKAHARRCQETGEVTELHGDVGRGGGEQGAPRSSTLVQFDAKLKSLRETAPVSDLLGDVSEEKLDTLVEAGCRAIVHENPTRKGVDAFVDTDFASTASYDPLHARLRILFMSEGERERHLSYRFLEKAHYRAFQARLKAAITASGVDRELPFRRLTVFRRAEVPSGKVSAELVTELEGRGGHLRSPTDDELATLWAIHELLEASERGLEPWLQERRPVSSLPLFAEDVDWLMADSTGPVRGEDGGTSEGAEATPARRDSHKEPSRGKRQETTGGYAPAGVLRTLQLGGTTSTGGEAGAVEVPLSVLRNHICVLAGSGSGKTVFLRRIIENAALLGVPAIVIDGANDLVRLGTPWPTPPDGWGPEDPELATKYFRRAEVVVWTPGKPTGNPVVLDPLPDFASIRSGGDDLSVREELDAARQMVVASLEELVAPGKSAKATKMRAILRAAVREISSLDGATLRALVQHLIEPSDDVVGLYARGESLAREAGELLAAAIDNDPLLGARGAKLDPGMLLEASDRNRVRVSVINLSGLTDGAQRQSFVNQLAMAMFTWVKKNPAKTDLSGLLVVDEAKDFVPSGKSVPSRESLIRLAAQARKYGLGLLFASQAPKSIDHNVVANCGTLLIGKQSSPAAIQAAEEILSSKGGKVSDVGRLETGAFYAAVKNERRPRKISTSLCLSHHPPSPPGEEDVLTLARESRTRLGGRRPT